MKVAVVFTLSDAQYKEFLQSITSPPTRKERLERLFTEQSILETMTVTDKPYRLVKEDSV